MDNSETLLTQILYLVQELHNDMATFNERLTGCERLTTDLQTRLNSTINDAFPGGKVGEHKKWHEQRGMNPIRRYFLKLLT